MAKKKSDSKKQEKRPKNPLSAQHQNRPGIEAKMTPKPEYLAPNYKGAEKLQDKVALITGVFIAGKMPAFRYSSNIFCKLSA